MTPDLEAEYKKASDEFKELTEELSKLSADFNNTRRLMNTLNATQQELRTITSRYTGTITRSITSTIDQISKNNQRSKLLQQEIESEKKKIEQTKKDIERRTKTAQLLDQKADQLRKEYDLEASKRRPNAKKLDQLMVAGAEVEEQLRKENDVIKQLREAELAQAETLKAKTALLKVLPVDKLLTTLNGTVQVLSRMSSVMTSFSDTIVRTQKQFGIGASAAFGLKIDNLVTSVGSYIDSLKSGFRTVGVSAEQIAETQQSFQEEFGGILTTGAATQLAEQAKMLGITAGQLAIARRVFMTQTMGNVSEANRIQQRFINEFAKKGLTATDAMATIAQNSELLARNGTRFAQQFARAAADAKKIGIDLGKISQVGDNIISNFEGFLESQAELGAMGFGFDTSRLSEIAITGDDAALFRELRSQLAGMGKDITQLNRPERLALESAYGINISEMQRLSAPSTTGAGEPTKSIEDLQTESNSLLGRIVRGIDALGEVFGGVSAVLSGVIAVSSAATAMFTGMTALGVTALAAPLLLVAGAIAGITAFIMNFDTIKSWVSKIPGSTIKKGDDVVSLPGYGKRSLLTPSGVISLNNKDNIVAYADDMMGTTRLPFGSITKEFAKVDEFKNKVTDVFTGLSNTIVGRFQNVRQSVGTTIGGLLGNIQQKQTGILTSVKNIPLVSNVVGMMSSIKEKGGIGNVISSNVGNLLQSNPLASKTTGIVSSVAKSGIGKLIGGTLGSAIPIPGVGTALGSLVGGGVGKLVGGLFGKKKKPQPANVPQMDIPDISTDMLTTLLMTGMTKTTPKQTDQIKLDISTLEKKFDQLIQVFSTVQINLDGNKVGQVLVANDQRAAVSGVFRAQRT